MKWIGHNKPNQEDVQTILQHVRLDLVDRRYLVDEVAFLNVFLNEAVKHFIWLASDNHKKIHS